MDSITEMARRICADCAGDAGTIGSPIAQRFLAGSLDQHPAMIAALAAIQQTTERAAKTMHNLAATMAPPNSDWCEAQHAAFTEAERIFTAGEHLKG